MQAQVKYESEIKTAVLGDRTITVKNLTPVFSPQEQDKRNREIERRLFDVFRKYAGRGQARVILVVRGRQRYNIIVGWLPFNGRELIMDSRIDAIYGRQSIDKKDSISIESQFEFCRYELKGGEGKEYKDKGYSGKNIERPDFQRLLQDIKCAATSEGSSG